MQTELNPPMSASNTQGLSPSPQAFSTAITARSAVAREFHNFIADIEDLITAATSLTGADLARAKLKLGERVAAAKQSLEELGTTVTQQVRTSAAATDTYVHQQPWKAIGIVTAVGVVLGFGLARRSQPKAQTLSH